MCGKILVKGSGYNMNELTNFEQGLKISYLNYENEDLNETLKELDRMLNILFKNDTQSDIFWKQEASNVFKAVILNNFYNKKEMTINDLGSLLSNQDEMKKNITEFGNNFKDNEFINTINIPDNTLKSVIDILQENKNKLESDIVNNFEKKDNGMIEITRDNYKNYDWNENIKYEYRGLEFECDHEYDAGAYMIWLNLPNGLNYKYSDNDNGDVPYKHQFDAGYMFGDNGPYFSSTVVEIMDYIDKYYEYFKSPDKDKASEEKSTNNTMEDIKCIVCGNIIKMDWSKIPNTEKIVYLKCSNCGAELKRGNPNYIEKEN